MGFRVAATTATELYAELSVTLTLGYGPTSPFQTLTYEVGVRQLPG